MALQRVVLRLTELRCLTQSEGSSGSEPYLWTTFFAFGAQQVPLQRKPLQIITPSYDAFRTEFPDGMVAGRAVPVPPFVASASFDIDLDSAARPKKFVGAIAVLMEEDSTPQDSIVSGSIAYSKAIENQLNLLADARIRSGNLDSITDAEIATIKAAVKAEVKSAIGSHQFNPFRDQDDNLGFMYKTFTYPSDDPTSEIRHQYFDFPDSGPGTSNNFRLSGLLSVGPALAPPVLLCRAERDALKAKQVEIAALQNRVHGLQNSLHHATPQQKAGYIALITETNAAITAAEAELPGLQAALAACMPPRRPGEVDPNLGGGGLAKG